VRASFVAGITNEALQALFERRPAPAGDMEPPPHRVEPGRVWVTRRNVFVDRIASAWLIRRFIDPRAEFKFVPARGYTPRPGELRFDMFEAEFTHEGDRCRFETLPPVRPDTDPPESSGRSSTTSTAKTQVRAGRSLRRGQPDRGRQRHLDDPARIERGAALFDDLYARFQQTPA
jgi:hypothetical protein